jgi:hypothetical protein
MAYSSPFPGRPGWQLRVAGFAGLLCLTVFGVEELGIIRPELVTLGAAPFGA